MSITASKYPTADPLYATAPLFPALASRAANLAEAAAKHRELKNAATVLAENFDSVPGKDTAELYHFFKQALVIDTHAAPEVLLLCTVVSMKLRRQISGAMCSRDRQGASRWAHGRRPPCRYMRAARLRTAGGA